MEIWSLVIAIGALFVSIASFVKNITYKNREILEKDFADFRQAAFRYVKNIGHVKMHALYNEAVRVIDKALILDRDMKDNEISFEKNINSMVNDAKQSENLIKCFLSDDTYCSLIGGLIDNASKESTGSTDVIVKFYNESMYGTEDMGTQIALDISKSLSRHYLQCSKVEQYFVMLFRLINGLSSKKIGKDKKSIIEKANLAYSQHDFNEFINQADEFETKIYNQVISIIEYRNNELNRRKAIEKAKKS